MSKNLLEVGHKAPAFTLKNEDGDTISLYDYEGKKNVVLYFYPKALTPGCTTQACGIRDSKNDFAKLNTVVLGMSPDPVDLLKKFQNTHSLNFTLLSDLDHKIALKYGAWGEKSSFGKTTMGLKRVTFIIDKEGVIKHVIPKVDTKTHHEDLLNWIHDNLK